MCVTGNRVAELSEQQELDPGETNQARRSRSGFWFGVIILLIIIGLAAPVLSFYAIAESARRLGW